MWYGQNAKEFEKMMKKRIQHLASCQDKPGMQGKYAQRIYIFCRINSLCWADCEARCETSACVFVYVLFIAKRVAIHSRYEYSRSCQYQDDFIRRRRGDFRLEICIISTIVIVCIVQNILESFVVALRIAHSAHPFGSGIHAKVERHMCAPDFIWCSYVLE